MICISKVSLIDSRLGTCCQKSLNTVQKGDLLIWYKYEACKRFSALQYNVESHQVYGSRGGRTWIVIFLKVHHRFSFDKSCNWGNLDFLEVARVQNCGYHQVRRVQYSSSFLYKRFRRLRGVPARAVLHQLLLLLLLLLLQSA